MRETIMQKCNRLFLDVEMNVGKSISLIKKISVLLDFFIEYRFHSVYLLDYIQYGFYGKRRNEREKYIVHGKLLELIRICNNPKHRFIFDQKPEFDKMFNEFLCRSWIYTKDATWEMFCEFIKDKDSFFAKQPDGMFGTGVEKVYLKDIENVETLFNTYKEKKILCEETLSQCKEMKAFNDSSINTLRIVTIVRADGNVEVMGGLLRVGRKGKIADNFHHQGICAFIDPITGIVCTVGVDKFNNKYIVHPDSGTQIVGFKVPVWDDVLNTVKRAALLVSDMRYIGWDVVITQNYKVALVEGNSGADPDAEQITTREGRWPYYERLLKEIKNVV